jgi:murein DD-endopeptidase MepM/ murein hydrolase activator NlpD
MPRKPFGAAAGELVGFFLVPSHKMRRMLLGFVLGVLAVGGMGCQDAPAQAPRHEAGARRLADIALAADSMLIAGTVPSGRTLGAMLAAFDLHEHDRHALVDAVQRVFDVRRLRVGQPFRLDRLFNGRVRSFEYEIDGDRRLRVQADPAAGYAAAVEPIAKEITIDAVEGQISKATPSLTQALDAAGERIDLALQMADIFSGELDFSSELQPGDNFRLVVERQTREGQFVGYGAILAAEFTASGRPLRAFRYATAGAKPAYYDEQGRSLKRFFLKSPLKFEPRITSRFSSSRKHPILGYTRAHNGVDYSAPTGAPVASVAPGAVTFAGWTNGGGRTVRVRHNNGYESEYLHLSAIDVRAGQHVSQGDVVGKVGATGLATGPHLHYGLRRNGGYVNPVVEHRNMPPGEPIPASELAAYAAARTRLVSLFQPSAARAAN